MESSQQNPLVTLSLQAVRGARFSTIAEWQEKVLESLGNEGLIYLFLLAFQTRDIRGGYGRGERRVFYIMMENLYLLRDGLYAPLVIALLPLVPEYGGWMDIIHFKKRFPKDGEAINEMFRQQLLADETALTAGENFSLLAKWLPREGNRDSAMAKELAQYFWDHDPVSLRKHRNPMGSYRKRCATLNKALLTVEVLECSNRWDEIVPEVVPARAREVKMSAYLNENRLGDSSDPDEVVFRKPDDPKRMACRENFQVFLHGASEGDPMNGSKTLFPHEILRNMMECNVADLDRINGWNAVWDSMVDDVLKKGSMESTVVMANMNYISLAMAIMATTLADPPFRNKFIRYGSPSPTWHRISSNNERVLLSEAVQIARLVTSSNSEASLPDIEEALDLVLATLIANRIKPGREPKNILIMGDRQVQRFGQSEKLRGIIQRFKTAYEHCGNDLWNPIEAGGLGGWKCPRIVLWNLEECPNFSDEGVLAVSGWSSSVFNILCQKDTVMGAEKALHLQLEDQRYAPIREVLSMLLR